MKKLGFGCMRLPLTQPQDAASVDLEQCRQMVDLFLARGFTYFDTAYFYHNRQSECFVRQMLVERHPRSAFVLADKMPLGILGEKTAEDQDHIFHEQLEKCGVDYFDYYLLHCIDEENYAIAQRLDTFSYLAQKKAEGKIRRLGFSFHDSAAFLDQVLTAHPEMDFVQLQINYLDWEDPLIQSRLCYETARRHQKPVVVMEPVKGGQLANLSQPVADLLHAHAPGASPASWAIRFAAGLDGVMMVLSGMSSLEQVADNTQFMDAFTPLTPEERTITVQAAQMLRQEGAIPCTACSYCTAGCPQAIPIPALFTLYNNQVRAPRPDRRETYQALTQSQHAASACISCGQCAAACPQHLDIPTLLHQQVAPAFER